MVVLSGQGYLTLSDDALLKQCAVDTFRSHGPGGQKRNKTSSAVRLRHEPTGLLVIAVEDRSQHVNKARAIRRLRKAIALTIRSELDMNEYAPSELMKEYVGNDGHVRIAPRNPNYVAIVAEVLDVLHAHKMRLRDAAGSMNLKTSHLVGFLENDPKLWAAVNDMRQKLGMRQLRC